MRGSDGGPAEQIFLHLLSHGERTQSQLIKELLWSRRTVSEVLGELLKNRTVLSQPKQASGPGRPQCLYRANVERSASAGIAVVSHADGEWEVVGVLTDLRAEAISEMRIRKGVPIRSPKPRDVLMVVGAMVSDLAASNKLENLSSVGVCLGGHIDNEHGVVVRSPNFKWRSPYALAQKLDDMMGVQVVLENDVNAMGMHRASIQSKASDNFSYVLVGDGIGSATIVDGVLFRGSSGGAGEIGHTVFEPNGRRCPCGRRGCLQTICGYQGIVQAARKAGLKAKKLNVRDVVESAAEGNSKAVEVLVHAGEALGYGLAMLTNIDDPGAIIVSSTELSRCKIFKDRAKYILDECTLKSLQHRIAWIESASEDAVLGAAWAAVVSNPMGLSAFTEAVKR